MPDFARHRLLHEWVAELRTRGAPESFTRAIACLDDDAIAAQVRNLLTHGPET